MSNTTHSDDRIMTINKPHDGMNVVAILDLGQFLEFPVDDGMLTTDTIHVVPKTEDRELHLYRWVDRDDDGNKRIKTIIENVSFGLNIERDDKLRWWCLQGPTEAGTFMALLDGFYFAPHNGVSGTDDLRLRVSYWEDNGKGMFDDERLTEESLTFRLKRVGDTIHNTTINSTYGNDVHMMARFKEGVL